MPASCSSQSKGVPGGSKNSPVPALHQLCAVGVLGVLRCCRQPGDAGAGQEVITGSKGRAGRRVLEVLMRLAFSLCVTDPGWLVPRMPGLLGLCVTKGLGGGSAEAHRWLRELRVDVW